MTLPSRPLLLLLAVTAASTAALPAAARDRYAERPPVLLSPDLTEPWLMQLRPSWRDVTEPSGRPAPAVARRDVGRTVAAPVRSAAIEPAVERIRSDGIAPSFLPAVVDYPTKQPAGSIVVDTSSRHLFLVLGDGKARRYGVGIGRPGFQWAGTHRVTRKAEWPSWVPPEPMLKRRPDLPRYMAGGPDNPLGARALYLGSTEYRIHGSNEPWTIGRAVSSGCIRMRNQDVIDLYGRVKVGTRVVVM